jgi:hypothetical protein
MERNSKNANRSRRQKISSAYQRLARMPCMIYDYTPHAYFCRAIFKTIPIAAILMTKDEPP